VASVYIIKKIQSNFHNIFGCSLFGLREETGNSEKGNKKCYTPMFARSISHVVEEVKKNHKTLILNRSYTGVVLYEFVPSWPKWNVAAKQNLQLIFYNAAIHDEGNLHFHFLYLFSDALY
jgi:hypothetical protein